MDERAATIIPISSRLKRDSSYISVWAETEGKLSVVLSVSDGLHEIDFLLPAAQANRLSKALRRKALWVERQQRREADNE